MLRVISLTAVATNACSPLDKPMRAANALLSRRATTMSDSCAIETRTSLGSATAVPRGLARLRSRRADLSPLARRGRCGTERLSAAGAHQRHRVVEVERRFD